MKKEYKVTNGIYANVVTCNGFWNRIHNFDFRKGVIKTIAMRDCDGKITQTEEPIFTVPLEGSIETHILCNTVSNPSNVGLTMRQVPHPDDKFAAYIVEGTLEHNMIEISSKHYYKKGTYKLLCIQDEPQEWSGWF